jgi:hypothetical protein
MTPSAHDDPPAIESTTSLVASDLVLASPLGGEVVLLEPEAGIYYSLNEVGALIWDRLQHPVTLHELCEAVVAEFEVDHATCEPDVRRVLGELMSHSLAEVAQTPTT